MNRVGTGAKALKNQRFGHIKIVPFVARGLVCVGHDASLFFAAVSHELVHRHQPRQWIVAFQLLKFLTKLDVPVLVAGLVTVDEDVAQTLADKRAEVLF